MVSVLNDLLFRFILLQQKKNVKQIIIDFQFYIINNIQKILI